MATQEKTWNVANRLHSLKDSDNPEVNHIIAGADEIYDDAKGAKQSEINAQADAALADRYTKAETYSKEQLDSLITTPDVNYVTVATFADLPQTGEADTIYRVSSYDGTQVDASKYALYAWNGATYQLLAVRSAADDGIFDVSEYNSGATYETLSAALAAVPASVQRGGMSIKFILRTNTATEEEPVYHDEYVQYRLMNTDWSTVAGDWQGVDSNLIAGSRNLVESGVVHNELALGAVYDVSAKNPTAGPNNDGKFESLSALLSDANLNTLIPTAVRKGGMSIKFVQSSDNKYVQYFLTKDEWSTNETDWEKVNLEKEINQLDAQINGSNTETPVLANYSNGYIYNNGVIAGTSSSTHQHTDAIRLTDDMVSLKCYALLSSSSVGGVGFYNNQNLPISTLDAQTKTVEVIGIGTGSVQNNNELINISAEKIAELKSRGAKYFSVCILDAGQKGISYFTPQSGIVNEIQDLDERVNTVEENLNQIDGQVNGANPETPISANYSNGYIADSGSISNTSSSTYKHTDAIALTDEVSSLKCYSFLSNAFLGGVGFYKSSTLPISSAQASQVTVEVVGLGSGSTQNNNELINISAEKIAELKSRGAKYFSVCILDAGQKGISYFTEIKGLVEKVQELEETIGIIEEEVVDVPQIKEKLEIDELKIFGSQFTDGFYWNNSGELAPLGIMMCTDKIRLTNISLIYAVGTVNLSTTVSNVVFFKEDGSLSSITPTMTWSSNVKKTLYSSDFPSDAVYAAFNSLTEKKDIALIQIDNGSLYQFIMKTGINRWADRKCVCYGDSITAQVGGYVNTLIGKNVFKETLRRAVGGQSYKWNSGCYYSEHGGDGSYLDRYIYNAQGQNTGVVVTKNTSAEDIENIESHFGVQIDIHYGCFCSWDRITSMIPDSVRQTIDAIILMGGTNDWGANNAISENLPEWSASNITDTDWVNSSQYNGGDYDVNTFAGAFMSTVMKLQVWCPNAIIIVCTPYGNWNSTTKKQSENTISKTVQDYANKEKEMATYLAIPIIDVNGLTTVNAFNMSEYYIDTIHPNAKGAALIANVIMEKLNSIYPNPK